MIINDYLDMLRVYEFPDSLTEPIEETGRLGFCSKLNRVMTN